MNSESLGLALVIAVVAGGFGSCIGRNCQGDAALRAAEKEFALKAREAVRAVAQEISTQEAVAAGYQAAIAACRERLIDANRQRVEHCAKVCAVPNWGYDESPGGCLECCIDPKNAQGQDCEYMYRGIGRLSE